MKKILSLLVLLLLIAVLPFSALAEGDGDGSGGGSSEPLSLASSSVPDGSVDVPLNTIITLTFSKNVVNMSVRDNNQTCFTLTDSLGSDVAINVILGDDQVDPSIKRIIEIQPQANLEADTTYTLTISQSITSKSGVSLAEDIVLSFTTGDALSPLPPETAVESTEPHSDTAASDSDSPSADEAGESPENVLDTRPADSINDSDSMEDTEDTGNSWLIYLAAGIVVVAAVIVLIILRKKKK